MRIIFLHHGGGDQYAYRRYKALMEAQGWEGVYFDLPGHGERFSEPLLGDIHEIAADAYEQLKPYFKGDYAFFGTSLGTLVAFLLSHKMMQNGDELPKHLFLASRKCPNSHLKREHISHLSSEDFWEKIRLYGGCPPALLNNIELREVYEPLLRADFQALEGYVPQERQLLPMPATILFGTNDSMSMEEMKTWQQHFEQPADILEYAGGHFFCYLKTDEMMQLMQTKLDV